MKRLTCLDCRRVVPGGKCIDRASLPEDCCRYCARPTTDAALRRAPLVLKPTPNEYAVHLHRTLQ